MLRAIDEASRPRGARGVSFSSSSRYITLDAAIGGGGPEKKGRGFDFEADPVALLARSLKAAEGEELRRLEDGFREGNGRGDSRRASSGRGERSDKSYSLGFLRMELPWLWSGRIGLSPRWRVNRGRNDDFVVMMC